MEVLCWVELVDIGRRFLGKDYEDYKGGEIFWEDGNVCLGGYWLECV